MNIKVGAASLNQTPLDWERNKANIIEALKQAREQEVQILCLPEMTITGYGCEDHFLSKHVREQAWDILHELIKHTDGLFTCFGIPIMSSGALYNAMAVVQNKKLLGLVPKQHLAGDGLHYEPRWFKAWPAGLAIDIENPDLISLGDIIFNLDVCIGFEICEDAFVAGRPGNDLSKRGADIILNPSASHFAFGKTQTRERLVTEGSRAFNVVYIYANLLGNEAGRAIYDGDCLIATGGDLVARGPTLNMKRVNLTTAVVDMSKVITKQVSTSSFIPNLYDNNVVEGELIQPTSMKVSKPISHVPCSKFAEFRTSIVLGLADYLEKSHSTGFVISLSGGADSAACAILVAEMVYIIVAEIGLDQANKRFGTNEEGIKEIVGKLLTCVYQSTSNSSETTLNAAKAIANEIGAKFECIDIEDIVKQYVELAEKVEGRKLSWETDDLALQNIQARARAPSIWMVANLENKLLITTSNRSEAAVGYCTMDGDTAGSIAPIGGIDKAFLLEWLHHMVRHYPSLNNIVCQQPTAELRPGQSQTDEDDLMPYNILDAIETWAILDKKGPEEVCECLVRELELERAVAVKYTKKFFTLFCRNQWKRDRFAPSLNLDRYNLDPKTWGRFPLLSGGFVEELANL